MSNFEKSFGAAPNQPIPERSKESFEGMKQNVLFQLNKNHLYDAWENIQGMPDLAKDTDIQEAAKKAIAFELSEELPHDYVADTINFFPGLTKDLEMRVAAKQAIINLLKNRMMWRNHYGNIIKFISRLVNDLEIDSQDPEIKSAAKEVIITILGDEKYYPHEIRIPLFMKDFDLDPQDPEIKAAAKAKAIFFLKHTQFDPQSLVKYFDLDLQDPEIMK